MYRLPAPVHRNGESSAQARACFLVADSDRAELLLEATERAPPDRLVMGFDLREGFVHVYVLVKIARVLDHLLRQSIFMILADASESWISVEKPF